MTPKEKAKELVHKYWNSQKNMTYKMAIKCALIAVDEIIEEVPMYTGNLNPKWKYWNEVKTEITKLWTTKLSTQLIK